MNRRFVTLATMSLALLAAGVHGEDFTWTGSGSGDSWDSCGNWTPDSVLPCYPASSSDIGEIPAPTGGTPWEVDLITETIDKLKLFGSVNFNGASPVPVITANVFRVNAISAGSEVVVTIVNGTITTDVP